METIWSQRHQLGGYEINKISISCFDNKCYLHDNGIHSYSTGHSQCNMLKTLTNSYEQIRSFANKNEVCENEVIKIRKNKVTTSLIHENEFVIPNSW